MTYNSEQFIKLIPVKKDELVDFKQDLREAFLEGLKDCFPEHDNPLDIAPVPPEGDVEKMLPEPDAAIYHLVMKGEIIGGTLLKIDEDTQHNEVIFLYMNANAHGKGMGTTAWQAIEAAYPDTKVWGTIYPLF